MASRKRSSKASGRSASVDESSLFVRLPGGETIPLKAVDSKKLMTLAMSWAYRVRYRGRWRNRPESRQEVEQQALADLENVVGIDKQKLQRIVDAGVAEIHIPFTKEEVGWEMRILPWESLLSAAANTLPDRKRFLVVRHLDSGAPPPAARRNPSQLLATSAPGALSERYSFESERALIESALAPCEHLPDPTLAGLRERIVASQPDVFHFTGIDAHEGSALLEWEEPEKDGLFLRNAKRQPEIVSADDFAAVVCAGKRTPSLFSCNAFNTGARIAALAVSKGCGAAIGFQDEIDNTLAELFFTEFHRLWRGGRQTLEAFQVALETAQEHPHPMSGSCIILWVGHSLLADLARVERFEPDLARRRLKKSASTARTGTGDGDAADLVVEVQALEEINYSLLHNGRPLFRRFQLANKSGETIRNVEVEVGLRVGREEVSTRRTFQVERTTDDYGARLALPLTWEVERYRESVLTNLSWTVSLEGKTIRRDSARVRLLPIDVWRDEPDDWAWLPSFVLPRDPAVITVVDKAQKYLTSLSDDRTAGFDGYQSNDPDYVDLQVRAVWSALTLDYDLRYVEPPPTYAKRSQRLRNPSSVVNDRRGTCIDLALLFCSCLEYVGLSAAIFLLKGHCFPAYWRSEQGPLELSSARDLGVDFEQPEPQSSLVGAARIQDPWVYARPKKEPPKSDAAEPTAANPFDRLLFGPRDVTGNEARLYGPLYDEALVPVETVFITKQTGLGEAIDAGWRNLEVPDDVEAMIDVAAARGHLSRSGDSGVQPVTPLPYGGILT